MKRTTFTCLGIATIVLAGVYAVCSNHQTSVVSPTVRSTSAQPNSYAIPSERIPLALTLTYMNARYGFKLSLPNSWKHYSVRTETENAYSSDAWGSFEVPSSTTSGENTLVDVNVRPGAPILATIPIVYIKDNDHPESIYRETREFPIEVFTIAQWNSLSYSNPNKNDIYVPDLFRSPVARQELGRNLEYVFAMSTRTFCHNDDVRECTQILASFHAF